MQKWEYIFLISTINENGDWVPKRINGVVLPEWAVGKEMYEISNELGEQGWELVSIAVAENSYRIVFKRPRE